MTPPWNSLEVAKLFFALVTPATLACLGIYIHHVTKRFENRQWVNQKVIEKRLAIYEQIAPLLNDLLCYFTYVGCWKDLDPPALIHLKRELDKRRHLAAPLFPASWDESARAFTHACFETFGRDWGGNAQLRTAIHTRRDVHHIPWQPSWDKFFSAKQADPTEIQLLYKDVLAEFSRSFGELDFTPSRSLAPLPGNLESQPVN